MSGRAPTEPAYALGADLTIAQAAEHHAQLLLALPSLLGDPRVDASGVTECDSSGIQLLLALRSSLADSGQTLRLVEPSTVVRDALSVFGLLEQFPVEASTGVH